MCLRIFYDFVWKICQIDPTQSNKGESVKKGATLTFCDTQMQQQKVRIILPKEQRSLRSVLGLVQLLCQGPGTVKREVIVIVIVMLDPS